MPQMLYVDNLAAAICIYALSYGQQSRLPV